MSLSICNLIVTQIQTPAMPKSDSIAYYAERCMKLFEELHEKLQRSATGKELSPESLLGESKRFSIWARNIVALQDARLPSSLEYRIRNDDAAIEAVKSALEYLAESLEIVLSIATGEKENETYEVEVEPSVGSPSKGVELRAFSETTELYRAIQDGIASLFQLSMIIRKKPETDEYIKAALECPIDPMGDIVRIGDKYPNIRGTKDWLSNRLGKAAARRRQYRIYRKERQEKMQEVHRLGTGSDGQTVFSGAVASTYHGPDTFPENTTSSPDKQAVRKTLHGTRTEYGDPNTGVAHSMNVFQTPPLPKRDDGSQVKYGEYFECPYCRRIQKVEEEIDWTKHIFSDLRPYVCTFEPCPWDQIMFDSQRAWFDHELQIHREQWACQFCEDQVPKTRPGLDSHLAKVHGDKLKDGEIGVEECKFPWIDAKCCPLCTVYAEKRRGHNQSSKVSLNDFQLHLASHMEQLVLADLPDNQNIVDTIPEEEEEEDHNKLNVVDNFSHTEISTTYPLENVQSLPFVPDLELKQALDRKLAHDSTNREPGATNLATDQATRPGSPRPPSSAHVIETIERERSPSRSPSPSPLARAKTGLRFDLHDELPEPEQSRLSEEKDLGPVDEDFFELSTATKKSKKDKKKDKKKRKSDFSTLGEESKLGSSQTQPPGFDPPEPYGPDSRVDERSEDWTGACWDSVPSYRLDRYTVTDFLQSLFGEYDFYTKFSMDHYQFWVPRKLTVAERDLLLSRRLSSQGRKNKAEAK
ncbi:hypothetical protein L207DRAFT_571914 [Hyaloscypha variabilis F]|uniref:Oxidoreductase acuF-like C2H2 type zinc-finger domain-containing protein n=1 Tax=Hyaloscypha variabilis (strain UAMH 11265 / GT02V1 / F) TaxID=1149755 RepID=A0A2J6R266_HYAVF|nr:hypothetical protein L207DRAFT_571914 [Hyaloscypha variabilis F]